jgi:D-glycero-D-manno-heptose 1,7-bisphosphate phosphatase
MPFTPDHNWYDFSEPESRTLRPALFLDRDGVLIEDRHYLKDPDDIALIEGSIRALKPFVLEGYFLIIVTNQSGIGRGLMEWDDLFAVQQRLRELWHQDDLTWDMALICPHHPEQGQGEYLQDNLWRKPHPGMFEFANQTLPIDMTGSIMVGDKQTDLYAAYDSGIQNLVHVLSGHGADERPAIETWNPIDDHLQFLSSIADLKLT